MSSSKSLIEAQEDEEALRRSLESVGKSGIEIAFHNSAAMSWVLAAIAELIPEATMTIDSKSIKLKGMDSSHVGLFDVHMNLSKLASTVKCADDKSFVIGFRTRPFLNFLSRFENNALYFEYGVNGCEDLLTMYEPVEAGSKRKQRNECKMKLIDIDPQDLTIPLYDDWIEVDMDAMRWKNIINAAHVINNDVISLSCTSDYFQYISDGDNGKVSWFLYQEDGEISITSSNCKLAHVTLSLTKVKQGCGKINVSPKERMKLRIIDFEGSKLCMFNYYIGDPETPECTLAYYLATRDTRDED